MDIKQYLEDYVKANIGQTDGKITPVCLFLNAPSQDNYSALFDANYFYCGYLSAYNPNATIGYVAYTFYLQHGVLNTLGSVGAVSFSDAIDVQRLLIGNYVTIQTTADAQNFQFIGYRIKIS